MRTKRNNYFCVLIILLVLIEITSIFLMYKSSNNRNTLLDNVNLKEQIKEMKGIAIMLEQSDGTYKESSSKAFPTDMKFKASMSGCIDNLGNRIENAITYTNGVVNVTTSNTTYCYLYFGQETALDKVFENSGEDIWESTLEDDGYRFVGTNPDNYICFGTTSKSECTGNTDLYMYRIIGIFEDEDGKQHLKLIKKEALEAADFWHMDNASVKWSESDLNANLNGGSFLELYTYPYMQDTRWTDKISTWNYTATNTITVENYRETGIAGPEYDYETVKNVYLHEMNRSSKTSTIEEWETVSSKIGLMYVSDYMLSLGNEALNYTGSSNYETLKTGWMHLENNDSGAPSQNEWTISLYGGMSTGPTAAYNISSNGNIGYEDVSVVLSTRPVFYLEDDTKLDSGTGSSDDPYIIKILNLEEGTLAKEVIDLDTSSDIGLQQDFITGDDLYRFSGTNGNTGINNYICLGTDSCTSGSDNMYRIIGVNPDNGEVKVIKETPWNNGTTYAWHSNSSQSDITLTWLTSELYLNTVSEIYDELTFNDMIVENHKWNVEGVSNSSTSTRSIVIDYENNTTGTATIGIMSMSDYYLAYNGDKDWYGSSNASKTTNWINGYQNGNTSSSGANEWMMTLMKASSSDYYSWISITHNGYVNYGKVTNSYVVRPTFYLKPEVMYIDGSGTSSDPFIVSYEFAADTLIQNVSSDVLWKSTLEDDGYRFVGTDPANYVCFGTTDISTCTSDTDKYMYRIIGIFEDSSGNQHLKLIKKEALNTSYAWHSDSSTDTNCEDSDLYKGINGSYFLTNTTYSYMQDTNWTNKIETWDYTATNTLTRDSSGPDYYDAVSVKDIYLHEMNRSTKTSSVGEWEIVTGKIGLMYVSDYLLSRGSSVIGYKSYYNRSTLKLGWMHLSNNDSNAPSTDEWSLTRYGPNNLTYRVWCVRSYGDVYNDLVDTTYSVRPVFYLTSDIKISGEGTNTSPYIIS